ncbi:MAG: PDZ domain-containing protein, partial [Planctomycetales bacterium]
MSTLRPLRNRLAFLRVCRASLRVATVCVGTLIAATLCVGLLFLADWLFQRFMLIPVRVFLMLAAAAASGGTAVALGWVLLRRRESEMEMALLVERHNKIDNESDVVAALQFESADAKRWGSHELEQAVINYVSKIAPTLNVLRGLSWAHLLPMSLVLIPVAGLLIAACVSFPGHFQVFLQRMTMANAHYPTRTVIDRILVNGEQVYPHEEQGDHRPRKVRIPYGEPLRLQVEASGRLPLMGNVSIVPFSSRVATELDLASQDKGTFSASLDRLVEKLEYEIFLGDAWTEPAVVNIIPLPAIEVSLDPTPPEYATANLKPEIVPPGSLQISVVEGSRVAMAVTPSKDLNQGTLRFGDEVFPLSAVVERLGLTVFPQTRIESSLNLKGAVAVSSVTANGPASQKDAIQPGDLIVGVGDERVADLSFWETVEKLHGPKGSKVTLQVVANGATQATEVELTRGEGADPKDWIAAARLNVDLAELGLALHFQQGELIVGETVREGPADSAAALRFGDYALRPVPEEEADEEVKLSPGDHIVAIGFPSEPRDDGG